MRLVFGFDEAVARFVSEGLQINICPPYTAIGVVDRNNIGRGGAVFHGWNGASMEITIYGPGAMQRGIIRAMFHYVFVQNAACRLTAKTKRSNSVMRKFLPRLGFEFEGTQKNYYGLNQHALVFRLDPDKAMKWM